MSKVMFKRKNTSEIKDLSVEDGSLIYNYETGETYMDYGNDRLPINKLPKTEKYENHTDVDTTSYSCDYINNLKPIVSKKDANGWIKIKFIDHIEYVYKNVKNYSGGFSTGWGVVEHISFPVGMGSLGDDRVLTCSIVCTDSAVHLSASARPTDSTIAIRFANHYNAQTGDADCVYNFRILEYK